MITLNYYMSLGFGMIIKFWIISITSGYLKSKSDNSIHIFHDKRLERNEIIITVRLFASGDIECIFPFF